MTKEIKKQEEQKQRTIDDLSDMELKALAFEKGEQVKQLQREYNFIYEALVKRQPKE